MPTRPNLDRKKTLSAARNQATQNAPRVKAPAKLWEQLAAARAPIATVTRPVGGFTVSEYRAQYGLTPSSAKNEIDALVRLGKIKRHGLRPAYYTFNE